MSFNLSGLQKSKSPLDIGFCSEHNRNFECYSIKANKPICPSCLMFGSFKGHEVISLEEANLKLRKELDLSLRQGLLKVENIQNTLLGMQIQLDIRHAQLTCEEQKQKVLHDCSDKFKQLITQIKQRKCELENIIEKHFNEQQEQLKQDEQIWVEKEKGCKDLINCAKSRDDFVILNNSEKIIDTLQELKKEKCFKIIYLINEVETNFKAKNAKENLIMNHQELLSVLESHMQIGDKVNLQYRV